MSSQANIPQGEDRNVEALRRIEDMGGSAAYKKQLASPAVKPAAAVQKKASDFPQVEPVVGNTWSAFVYTSISVACPSSGHNGNGHAFGLGVGDLGFAGVLSFESWDTLKSADNEMYIAGDDEVAGGVIVYLSINGNPVGLITAPAAGLDAVIGINGTMTWT